MTTIYKKTSPWAITQQTNSYLDFYQHRSIPARKTDRIYKIPSKYNQRPDLAAFELYGKADYWWIFSIRNPDEIQDPIFDFITDLEIKIPTFERLTEIMS